MVRVKFINDHYIIFKSCVTSSVLYVIYLFI